MGNVCTSESLEDREERTKNKRIEQQLRKHRQVYNREVKILLLGAGESGKSTIFKQMKLLQDNEFDKQTVQSMKRIIRQNIVSNLLAILRSSKNLNLKLEHPEEAEKYISFKFGKIEWDQEIFKLTKILWEDSGVKETLKTDDPRRMLGDSCFYFFESLDRIGEKDYLPTEQDILRARVRTTGLQEAHFKIGTFEFLLCDVGGQRNERRKWIHIFDNITSVLFCASLTGYSEVLREDYSTIRMEEAMNLFSEVCRSPHFKKASIILFLNKFDLFKEKIKTIDLDTYFHDYKGNYDAEEATSYITQKFIKAGVNKFKKDRDIFPYATTAVDTKNIKYIFDSVSNTIMQTALEGLNFL
ncbi:guanine nucleotide-binding protein g(o) subunit alpha [Anaeramoeba flamelloides]|uniref:Guanine nucleotide-binding protein g(O) subunit alpha n=1 Tax=Anaeramoeba flamelloides TaxID=1746091 RepID=A0AAV7Z8C1_9EUKA|nr:guanine nucleotide-binding protein g(o) subunit alpha [Anaeramoeba flamelloides]